MAQCSYAFAPGDRCRHEAVLSVEGKALCIFHLPADKPAKGAFWKHLASYLCALLDKAGNDKTARWVKVNPTHWVFTERDQALFDHCQAAVKPGEPWDFRGFVFPAMDDTHSFGGFIFPAADFISATFSGAADFRDVTFSGGAGFGFATFSGYALFYGATFSGKADFNSATFSGDADFGRAAVSGDADFVRASFSGEADFSFAEFRLGPSFGGVKFDGPVDFYDTRLPGLHEFDDERTARYIRRKAEQYGCYADAGDFYIVEMEFRRRRFRKTPRRWLAWILMEFYRLFSRYGESPGRAALVLLALTAVSAVVYLLTGFKFGGELVQWRWPWIPLVGCGSLSPDIWTALRFSIANLIPHYQRFLEPTQWQTATGIISMAQVILSYVVFALLLLAIRRRFSR